MRAHFQKCRARKYTCRFCTCYLITYMKNEKQYTYAELQDHLRHQHQATPQAVKKILEIWHFIDKKQEDQAVKQYAKITA